MSDISRLELTLEYIKRCTIYGWIEKRIFNELNALLENFFELQNRRLGTQKTSFGFKGTVHEFFKTSQ